MKYKIFGLFFATALFIILFKFVSVNAATSRVLVKYGYYSDYYMVFQTTSTSVNVFNYSDTVRFNLPSTSYKKDYPDFASAYSALTDDSFSGDYRSNFTQDDVKQVIVYGPITINNTSNIPVYTYEEYEDIINPPPPEPLTWYEELWSDFLTFVDDNLVSILTPFEISSIFNIADWFADAWTVKVGEGEDALALALASPTPAPTPIPIPTQIPYQTIMSPDGNGGYTINYIYNNPQGTPIITSSPPTQVIPTGSINITDNDFEYPYYDNPDNKDNPFEFKIPWYLKLILNDNDIDIDSLDANYKVAQSQVQSDNIMDAVSSIYDGFQILPSGWLLILGAIASLPLIAALIHRMLNG